MKPSVICKRKMGALAMAEQGGDCKEIIVDERLCTKREHAQANQRDRRGEARGGSWGAAENDDRRWHGGENRTQKCQSRPPRFERSSAEN